MGSGSGVVPAAAWVTAVACVQSLAQELPCAAGMAKKKKKKKESFDFSPNPQTNKNTTTQESRVIHMSHLTQSKIHHPHSGP